VIEVLKGFLPGLKVQRVEKQVGDARHTSADITQARNLLHYAPKVTVPEGLKREVEWLMSCNPK
jgi:nucleoside-diphosphate-sugar epimerase